MALLDKLRAAFARPPARDANLWRSPAGQRWSAVGTPVEHDAIDAVLRVAGFTREADALPTRESSPDVHLLLTGTTDPTPQGAAGFLHALQAHHAGTPPGTPIRHPAVLAADVPLAQAGLDAWAVTGYPGTGNVVLQNILMKLDALRPPPGNAALGQTLRRFAEHHAAVVHAVVHELLAEAGSATGHATPDIVLAPGHLGQCSVRATYADGTALLINHLPHAGFLGQPYGAHSRWTDEAAAFFPRFGYRRVYLAVRDPLAVLCSNAAKTVRPLEHALHDLDWFLPTAKQLAAYDAAAQQHRDAFRVIRYEDLTTDPRSTIQQLGRDADLELSDDQADAIWEAVGFKALTPAGEEHLFNPTADKRPHFRSIHADWINQTKLADAFTAHGYSVPTANDFPQGERLTAEAVTKRPSALYGRIDPRTMHAVRDEDLQLWVRSDDPQLPPALIQALKPTWRARLLHTLDDRFGKLELPASRS